MSDDLIRRSDAVNELATEAERMIQFMDETAMTGYEKLLETSKDYQNDVGSMNQMMTEFANSSEALKVNVESIRDSVNSVNIAIEESAKGISNVSKIDECNDVPYYKGKRYHITILVENMGRVNYGPELYDYK